MGAGNRRIVEPLAGWAFVPPPTGFFNVIWGLVALIRPGSSLLANRCWARRLAIGFTGLNARPGGVPARVPALVSTCHPARHRRDLPLADGYGSRFAERGPDQ